MALKDLIKQAQQSRLGKAISGISKQTSQNVQNWQAQNRQRALQTTVPTKYADPVLSFGRGMVIGQTGSPGVANRVLNRAGYTYGEPRTQAGQIAQGIGTIPGYLTGIGKLLGPAESGIASKVGIGQLPKTAPILNRVGNAVARKTIPAVAAEGFSSAALAGGEAALTDRGFTPAFGENLAWGLGTRGALGAATGAIKGVKNAINPPARSRIKTVSSKPTQVQTGQARDALGRWVKGMGLNADKRTIKVLTAFVDAKRELSNMTPQKRKEFNTWLFDVTKGDRAKQSEILSAIQKDSSELIPRSDGSGLDRRNFEPAYGAIAGFEPETDEEGNITGKVNFDPTKAALGVGVMGGIKAVKGGSLEFKSPYKRGDLAALNRQIDKLIGFDSSGGNYKQDYAMRESMIKAYLNDDSIPPDFKKQLQDAVDQLDMAKEAKLNPELPTKTAELQGIINKRRELIDNSTRASQAITDATKNYRDSMGLVGQEVMNSPEVKRLQITYQATRDALGEFNKRYAKDKQIQKAFKEDTYSRMRGNSLQSNSITSQPTKGVEASRLTANTSLGTQNQTKVAGQTTTNSLESLQQTPKKLLRQQTANGLSGTKGKPLTEKSLIKDQILPETKLKVLRGESQPYFNTKNYKINKNSKQVIESAVSEVKPAIEKLVGKRLSNKEVIQKANVTAKILNTAVSRDQTEAWEAALLKTRQKLAALSESGTVDQEYIDTLVTIKSLGTDIGRKLQSFGIGADPALVTSKQAILEAVTKVEKDTDKILKAAQGVDFNDLNQATTFYRKFVKPTLEEKIDLLRYNSMLSSPNTHINNAFSNFQGTGLIAPLEKTIAGGVDALRAVFNRQPRTRFAGEGAAYAKGYYSNMDKAFTAFTDVMRGKSLTNSPDVRNIPLYPSGRGRKYENILAVPMKLLEASDQFFTALTKAGSESAFNYRIQKGNLKGMNVQKLADDEAARRLFRSDLGDNNGSLALNALDIVANQVQALKNSENPIVRTIAKYSLPFLRTPTNILKQAVEYTPFGISTLPGSKDKTAQVAKMILGSSIGVGVATLVGGDRLTWAEPAGEKQKQAFKAAGLQPYSVKIGNKWVSYSKLHPAIAFNFALVAAIRNAEENKTLDDGQVETLLQGAMKWVNFFADQSYMKNIGDIVSATKGDVEGFARLPSNYTQQFVPFRALLGWAARLTDPYQRRVDPDGSILEKQLGYLAAQIPGLSQTVPARLDQFDNPIENQNRGLNAVSPLRVTTENPVAKEDYEFLKEKAKLEKDKRYLKAKLKDEAETVVTAGQVGASDTEYIPGTGLRKLSELEKDKVDTYLEFGKAVSKEDLENSYLGDLAELPSSNRYETSLKKKEFLSKLSTIKNDEKLSTEQKTVLKERIAQELKLTVPELDNYVIANGSVDEKTLHAYDQLDQAQSFDDFLRFLANGRKPLNGKIVVSDDVIDNLVEDGIIPEALGKDFKSLDLNEDGTIKKGKIKGRSGKAAANARAKAVNDAFEDLKRINIQSPKIRATSGNKINTRALTFSGS